VSISMGISESDSHGDVTFLIIHQTIKKRSVSPQDDCRSRFLP